MADPDMYAPMVKDGVIWGLSKSPKISLLQLCCKALACLSYDHAGAMLESKQYYEIAIHLIFRLTNKDFQRCGGVIS